MRRESIEALSVSFAIGVAAGALLCPGSSTAWMLAAMVSAIFFILAAFILLRPGCGHVTFMAAYVLAGMLCFLTDRAGGRRDEGTMDPLTATAESSARWLKGKIDDIPYSDPGTSGLVKALLTGDRSGIGTATRDVFRTSGASHILALSGLHMGFIYMMLLWIMVPFGNSPPAKRIKCAVTIGSTFFFSLATGFSPSVTRAFLFIAANEILKILGREKKPSRVLCIALFIQLAINPAAITTVGFQLSYLAMCGIVLLYPVLESWYPADGGRPGSLRRKADIPRRIWQAAALAISCQVFTAPAVWIYFHSFPSYFLLTNLLAMPVTSMVMVTSVAAVFMSSLGICPAFLVAINEKAVSTLIWILTVISGM